MHILVTGQAGTHKATWVQALKTYGLKRTGGDSRAAIEYFEVENARWLRHDFLTFLTNYQEAKQQEIWAESIQRITEPARKAQHSIILIHATFYRDGRFFSPISWDHLLLFQPDCVITLIDDLYDIWQRIEDGPHDTHLSLLEILAWRSVEIANARAIASNLRLDPKKLNLRNIPKSFRRFCGPPIPHYVMSVKHSLETFYRLLYERDQRHVVYASFPITRTRARAERMEDINDFRRRLSETGAVVVDPLTIDELRLGEDDPRWLELGDDGKFQEYQDTRWPIVEPAMPPPNVHKNPFRGLSPEQITAIRNAILEQVVDRDFRLVAQCDKLIAYRPFYPEHGSQRIGAPGATSTGGVTREIAFALGLDYGVWGFHPRTDWRESQEKDFFGKLAIWNRIRRFPPRSRLVSLPETDFSGFDELLQALPKENKGP